MNRLYNTTVSVSNVKTLACIKPVLFLLGLHHKMPSNAGANYKSPDSSYSRSWCATNPILKTDIGQQV